MPLGPWLRTDLKEDILDALRGGGRARFFARASQRLTDSFFRGDDTHNYQMWTLYAFELWYRNVMARPPQGGRIGVVSVK